MRINVRTRTILAGVFELLIVLGACSSGSEQADVAVEDVISEPAAEPDADVAADESSGEDTSDDAAESGGGGDSGSGVVPVALSSSDRLESYTFVDEEFGTAVTVTVDGDVRTIDTNALPDHETGEFPNSANPNTISEQDLAWEFPTSPTFNGESIDVGIPGIAVNGVKFEPGTAETVSCDSGEVYRVEGLQNAYDLGMDFNNAHVQPTGEYHYHGISELLVEAYENDDDLVHIGFAADGYLIYYSKSGAYDSSYMLSTDDRTGTDCVGSGALAASGVDSVAVEGTTPDGTYTSDWIFGEEFGDLDGCNGTTIDGQYAYMVTDAYPYISRCLNGEVTSDAVRSGGAGAGAPTGTEGAAGSAPEGAATPPDLTEAAETLGVTIEDLGAALGGPPPWDLEAVAEQLGVTVADLEAVLPAPSG